MSNEPKIDPAFDIAPDVLANAEAPSDINPEPGAPPSVDEIALRLAELRGEHQELAAKFARLCASLAIRDL